MEGVDDQIPNDNYDKSMKEGIVLRLKMDDYEASLCKSSRVSTFGRPFAQVSTLGRPSGKSIYQKLYLYVCRYLYGCTLYAQIYHTHTHIYGTFCIHIKPYIPSLRTEPFDGSSLLIFFFYET